MSDSLRDQLLKAGLVSRDQVRQAEQSKRRKNKAERNQPGKKKKPQPAERPAAKPQAPSAPKAAAAKPAELDRKMARRRAREEGRMRKLLDRRLQGVLETAVRNDPKADITHHFTRGNKITHLYVTAAQQRELAAGELAIVGFHGRHYLVAWAEAQRMRDIDPKLFVFRHDPDAPDPEAEHPVPDDLQW